VYICDETMTSQPLASMQHLTEFER